MPIKGMTDTIQPEYPRLGKLRKGAKKTDPKRPGKDLTYFRFTSENEDVEAAFFDECGRQPTAIEVYLPHATTEENFPTWMEKWNGSGTMLHRCDGEKCVIWHDDEGYHNAPLGEGPTCPGNCKHVGRLQVIIPALIARGFIGTVCAETHGKHDVINISRALKQVEELCNDQGGEAAVWGLRRVGFTLYRSDCEVSSPAWKDEKAGKRHKVTKSLVKIVPSQQWAQAQMLAAQEGRLALPEPDSEEVAGDVVDGIVEEIPEEGPDWDEVLNRCEDEDTEETVDDPTGELITGTVEPAPAQQGVRPLDPDTLRDYLQQKIDQSSLAQPGQPATNSQRGLVAGKLEECFAPEIDADAKRKSVLFWLTGSDTTKDLSMAQASALLDWLLDKNADPGTYDLHPHAPEEARRVLAETEKQAA